MAGAVLTPRPLPPRAGGSFPGVPWAFPIRPDVSEVPSPFPRREGGRGVRNGRASVREWRRGGATMVEAVSRQGERSVRRAIVTLCLVIFLADVVFGIVAPTFSLFAKG